ncbi:hypothetical protein B1H10_05970 [candidate division KSB1 bacterium 4484_188]|nr:MAG: hypothetical protein B1H10_05970 [candidate division KSB1 bacterium 4484_188]
MKKIYLCRKSEVTRENPFVFNLNHREQIVLFSTTERYFAVENRYPYAGANLHEGIVENKILMCVWRGWRFDLESGQCLNEYRTRLKTYPVFTENDKLFLVISTS